jgi:hypothetical protein
MIHPGIISCGTTIKQTANNQGRSMSSLLKGVGLLLSQSRMNVDLQQYKRFVFEQREER